MFARLWARLGAAEAPLPWSFAAALGALAALVAGVLIIGPTVVLLLNPAPPSALILAGWTLGGLLAAAFVYIRFKTPAQRARLWGLPEPTPAPRSKRSAASTAPLPEGGRTLADLFFMLLVGVGLAVALDVIAGRVTGAFLPEPELLGLYTQAVRAAQPIPLAGWGMAFLFMVLVQPLAEEWVFRGALQPALRGALGPWPGYLLCALTYALFHLLAFSGAPGEGISGVWYGLVNPLIGGLIFGAIRLYTGSTRAAVLAHVGFGLFAIVKLLTLPV